MNWFNFVYLSKRVSLLFFSLFLFVVSGCSFSQNRLQDYPKEQVYRNLNKALKDKDEVKILILSNENFVDFPHEIFQFLHLKVLVLHNCKINTVPKEIRNLQQIERLELMKNNLTNLPYEIIELKKLKRLNVAYNNICDKDVAFIKRELLECLVITDFAL